MSHGGELDVESEPGKGTTFHIYLPLVGNSEPDGTGIYEERTSLGKERILLVDDEADVALVLGKSLEYLGYGVTARTSSLEAIEEFRKEPERFDLVVTDYTMPGMNGLQLSRELKEIRDIPVILTSGYNEMVQPDNARELGLSEMLMKPFTAHELSRAIRRVLEEKEIE